MKLPSFTLISRLGALAALTLVTVAHPQSARAQARPNANLYAADIVSGAILKIAPDGTQTTFSSVGSARGLAFDQAGNLYVADSNAQSIIKITPSGVQSTFASGFDGVLAIAFDQAGNLYAANQAGPGASSIFKFTPAGVRSTFASGLDQPAELVFDGAGNLFETDFIDGTILRYTPSGVQSTFASGLNAPAGLAFDSQGNLYEADQGTRSILKFAPNGTRQTFASLAPDIPIRLAIDTANNVYVSANPNGGASGGIIYQYTPAGARSTFATETDRVGFLTFGPTLADGGTPASQLQNIATRLRVNPDPNQLIGGFIITGSEPKKVIIRATGPSLASFFSDVLANPTLELFQGSTMLASNDDWKDTDRAAIEATGVAPKNDLESAIVQTLAPGAYTAIVRGKNGTSGIGLVEAYDLNAAAKSQFGNIATRGFVDTDNNVMIGGFIIGGNASANARVVVRAIGPSLKPFGIDNALADPTLELRDANGSLLKGNDNWKDSQQAEIEATGLAPTNNLESAVVATLPNGSYTAIVRGNGNTTGVGVVEVYSVK